MRRSAEEIKDRIRMAIVEDMSSINTVLKEPENQFPQFIEKLTNHLTEIALDEITFRRK